MFQTIHQRLSAPFQRLIAWLVISMISFGLIIPPQYAYAQSLPLTQTWLSDAHLTTPGQMVKTSATYNPTLIKGLRIYPNNPLRFDFIVETGDEKPVDSFLYEESNRLIKYFLASLTIPEQDMWVNLSPFEQQRIIPEKFGITEMGRDLLAQDYILKQLTASMMYPEDKLGEQFWKDVRQKIEQKYGITEIPMDTFVKVWIVPAKAVVYENDDTAFVVESKLKVMLEQDYIAHTQFDQNKNIKAEDVIADEQTREQRTMTAEIIREILIPAIEKEVNEGKHFATLRQVYHSMILATWFKRNLKESLLGRIYLDQSKTGGVDVDDKEIKQKIYEQYLEAFKVGVYNYVKEEYDPVTEELIPRKYFSGGMELQFGSLDDNTLTVVRQLDQPVQQKGVTFIVEGGVDPVTGGIRSGMVNQQSTRIDADTLGISERFDEEQFRQFQRQTYNFLNTALQTLVSDLTSAVPGETRAIEAPVARFLAQMRQRLAELSQDNRRRNEFLRQYQSMLRVYVNSIPAILSDLNGLAVSPATRQKTEENGVTGTRITIEVKNETPLQQQIVVQQYDTTTVSPFFEAGVRRATVDHAVLTSTGQPIEINWDEFFGDRTSEFLTALMPVIREQRQAIIRVHNRDFQLLENLSIDLNRPVFRAVEIKSDGTISEPFVLKFFSQFLADELLQMDKVGLMEFFLAASKDERLRQFFAMPTKELDNTLSLQPNMIEMQLIKGRSLRTITNQGERLRLLAELANELAYMSTTYTAFHGDLSKEENIIIDETTGRPRLIDWDTLKMDLNRTDVRALPAGIKYKDIRSLGLSLLHTFSRAQADIPQGLDGNTSVLLTAVNPAEFRGQTTFVGTPQNDMPASIWNIVQKALFAHPTENYESMEDLSNDLNRALAGLDLNALPQSDNAVLATDVQTIKGQEIHIAPLTREMLLGNPKYRELNSGILRFKSNPLENRKNMDDYSFVLLDKNNEPVGYVIIETIPNGDTVFMTDLVVAPEFQGTQAASWLLHHTFTNVVEKSQGALTSARWLYNYFDQKTVGRAAQFYKAIGAKVTVTEERDWVRKSDIYRFNFAQDMPTLFTKFQNDLRGVELPAGANASPVSEIETPAAATPAGIPAQITPEVTSVKTANENVGGIDLNPTNLIIEKQGKGINMSIPLDPTIMQELESMPIDGFAPVIFQIIPVNNLPLLLGIATDQPDETKPEISILKTPVHFSTLSLNWEMNEVRLRRNLTDVKNRGTRQRSWRPYIKEDDSPIFNLSAVTP